MAVIFANFILYPKMILAQIICRCKKNKKKQKTLECDESEAHIVQVVWLNNRLSKVIFSLEYFISVVTDPHGAVKSTNTFPGPLSPSRPPLVIAAVIIVVGGGCSHIIC